MTSFAARHRAILRATRRAEVRAEVRAGLEQLRAQEAGELPPLTLAEAHARMGTSPGLEMEERRPQRVTGARIAEYRATHPIEPEPEYLHSARGRDAERRRMLREARPIHRPALLLACGYAEAGHEVPEAILRALLGRAPVLCGRHLRRALERDRLGTEHRRTEQAPHWATPCREHAPPVARPRLGCIPARSLAPPLLAGASAAASRGP
jgi:hypothetical protein